MRTLRRVGMVVVAISCGLVMSLPLGAQTKSLLLFGFEPGEAKPADAQGEAVKEHATQGEYSFKVTTTVDGYVGVRITDKAMLAKFKDYVLLKADIYNPRDEVVPYALRIDDAKSTSYGTRYNDENFVAPPGKSMLELNITSLLRSSSKNFSARDKLDVAALTLVNVFMGPRKDPVTLYIDNIRLESSGLPPVEGLRAFDFGPAKAAVYPGFEGVNEKMPYAPERGFGWNKPESCDRVYTPDDLSADYLRGGGFEMDLPNGAYEVNVCIDPFGAWHRFPSYEWRKLILNGKTVLDETMTGAEFLEKRYFLHEDDEDLPGDDAWAKYVVPRNVVRRYPVEVTDGKLTFKVDSDNKHGKPCCFLVVYPAAKEVEGRKWMASLDAVRKERFNRNLYVIVPKQDNPPPALTDPDRKRTFIPFVRHTELDVAVTSCPTDAERKTPLAIEAAQGEREHLQLGLYPAGQSIPVQVKVSDLVGANGGRIPASAVEVRRVRNFLKHMGRARAGTILPYILMDTDRVMLHPGVTRALWFTVSVPETAAPGDYMGTVTLMPVNPPANPNSSPTLVTTLPLKVTVLPFKLEPARSITLSTTGATGGHWDYWYPDLRERWWKCAEAVMKDYADHGMNAITGGPGARLKSIENGKAVIDYSDMDRWLALAAKHGLTMPGDSYQGLDVSGIPLDSRDLKANDKEARDKYGVSYSELIRLVFEDVEKHAKERGWSVRSYYLLDEPRPEFGNIDSALELVRIWTKAAPNTRFAGYYTAGQGRDPYFEVMPVTISHFGARELELSKKAGKELWDYDGGRSRFNIGRWAFAASKVGLKGYLRNGYMYVNSDPYFDFSDDEASWCVVYPSKRNTVNAAVGWERTAQGANDFRYLEMLDGLIRKAAANPRAAACAAAAKTFLDGTLAPIDLDHRETANLKPAEFDAFKHTCATHIVALKKALGE